MTIQDSINKQKAYEGAFNLIRWGEGIPEKTGTKGWPAMVDDLDSGRFNAKLVGDFRFERVRIFTFDNDDNTTTTKLVFTLRVADPNHQASGDSADFKIYLPTVDELEDESLQFPKTKTRSFLQKLLEYMGEKSGIGLIAGNPLDMEWDEAINKLLLNFEKLDGKIAKAWVGGVMYVPKDDPTSLRGPYMEVNGLSKDTDGSYAEMSEAPF